MKLTIMMDIRHHRVGSQSGRHVGNGGTVDDVSRITSDRPEDDPSTPLPLVPHLVSFFLYSQAPRPFVTPVTLDCQLPHT